MQLVSNGKLVVFFAMVFCSNVVFAQSSLTEPEIIPANARGCQQNTINIANLKQIARIQSEKIFVIAHRSTGEKSRNLNRRRLNDIGTEFDQGSPMDRQHLILAEGNRVKGQAHIDFYLGNNLHFISYVARNGDFCSLCCDRKRLFYM